MTDQSVFDLPPLLAANRRYWSGWAGADPEGDLAIYRTGIPHQFLNGILRLRNRLVDSAIAEARSALEGATFSWWFNEADSDPGIDDQLTANGAAESKVVLINVSLTDDLPPFVAPPTGLTVQSVSEEAEMRDYVQAYAGPLGFPPEALELVVERELEYAARDDSVTRFAGVIDGKTVGTLALSLGGDVAGLYFVTDTNTRGLDVKAALVAQAVQVARDNGAAIIMFHQGQAETVPVGFSAVGFWRIFQFPE